MRKILFLIVLSISIFVVACSNDSGESEAISDMEVIHEEEKSSFSNSVGNDSSSDKADEAEEAQDEEATSTDGLDGQVDRKIIYTANLTIEVKDYQQTLDQIQTQVSDRGGYIVESNSHGGQGDEMTSGYITVRIPQDLFHEFVRLVEEGSNKVLESSTSGQDVTEEYVDLESRLKSKRVVEERLLSFMEQAEKTEDLLTISNDLATVQEDIEEIMGRMKYLENKSDLATVTIHIQENNVTLSSMDEDNLDTWDRTKQQFLKSINMLLSFFSSLVVLLIGNLPVLLLLAVIGLVLYWIIRKKMKNNHSDL
ncbi:DUF4349 domain-containing protein [Ornithinibacillus sp. L9]|uniref:DUF4349 domain-containing protein n=1 Tax=Ornithinibacillus caprae TaxID=2678566 RepID=A0A6N8FEY5_9BACI|nr:DUF4349 domain-containing protein [Ornithinibacillus caprae]MUK87751.1 DUF4349 domain-containing protein [Ornithinibacillus caprae]